jgi:peptidyl-prolyl cis-trans isomerase A (cyclophilin A)
LKVFAVAELDENRLRIKYRAHQLNGDARIAYRRRMHTALTLRSTCTLAAVLGLIVAAAGAVPTAQGGNAALSNPAALKEQAPANFTVNFDTSMGSFVVTVHRAWAPHGADRFYNLVKNGFYNNARFFRALPNFMVQFGIHADPTISAAWRNARLPADKVIEGNKRGRIVYAMGGSPDTRTTQVFINFRDNSASLDKLGFAAFGEVTTGMEVVDKVFTGYGEGAPSGNGPEQGRIQAEGNAYLMKSFPKLDYIKSATIGK